MVIHSDESDEIPKKKKEKKRLSKLEVDSQDE